MTVAYSEQRKIEDALVGLLEVNSEVVELGASVKGSYEVSENRKSLQVVVYCESPENENLAATGGGNFYSAVVRFESGFAPASDGGRTDKLDRLHGACERFWRTTAKATINTALSGITVHGIVGAPAESEQIKDNTILARSSARMLHYEVTA